MITDILIHEPDSRMELDYYGEVLSKEFPEVKFHLAHNLTEAAERAKNCQAMIAKSMHVDQQVIGAMPKLEWFQSLISGIDHLRTLNVPRGLRVSAARGIHGTQMSELAILLMLALNRNFPSMLKNQASHDWNVWTQPLLESKRLLILGVGAIAETIASRCVALGMRVAGVSRRTEAEGFEKLYSRARIHEAVAEADFVLALTPLSDDTRSLVNQGVFKAMKPTAYLVNIARGGIVDEPALINALKTGEIAGAAVDVAQVEPLPPENPLWDAPNLIITPHVGGRSNVYHQQVMPLLIQNTRRYLDGDADQIPFQIRL